MRKKTIAFRLSRECHDDLAELAEDWNCTRTEVIERLVAQNSLRRSLAVTGLAESAEIMDRIG